MEPLLVAGFTSALDTMTPPCGGIVAPGAALNIASCCACCSGRQVALDVAQGLAYLHSQSVLHSDIKST